MVKVALDGVPRAGVTKVGLVAKTKAPDPVSSVTAAARLDELGVAKKVATPVPKEVMPVPPEDTGRAAPRVRTPVLGLNCSLVDDTFAVVMLPVEALVKVK